MAKQLPPVDPSTGTLPAPDATKHTSPFTSDNSLGQPQGYTQRTAAAIIKERRDAAELYIGRPAQIIDYFDSDPQPKAAVIVDVGPDDGRFTVHRFNAPSTGRPTVEPIENVRFGNGETVRSVNERYLLRTLVPERDD